MTRSVAAVVAGVAAAGASLSGCAIPTDSGPRDIPEDQRRAIATPEEAAGEAGGETRIFLVSQSEDNEGRVLHSVARDVDDSPGTVLDALLQGPNDNERRAGIDTLLPEGLTLSVVRNFPRSELVIETSSELSELPGDTQVLAVAQIVATATEIDEVSEVSLQLEDDMIEDDDELQRWPIGNGELVDRPLTVYDYPELLDTVQPAYPPVPSGSLDEQAAAADDRTPPPASRRPEPD